MDPAAILERVLDEPRVAYVTRGPRHLRPGAGRPARQRSCLLDAVRGRSRSLLVTLGVAGVIAGDTQVQAALADGAGRCLPAARRPHRGRPGRALERRGRGRPSSASSALVWTVSQFYVTLDVAFARIFSAEPERDVVPADRPGLRLGRDPDRRWSSRLIVARLGRDRARRPRARHGPDHRGRSSASSTSLPVLLALDGRRRGRPLPGRAADAHRRWRSLLLPAAIAAGRDRGCSASCSRSSRRGSSGSPPWRDRSRRRSSPWPGCRSRSRRCSTARPGSGSATTARARPRVSPGGSRSAGRTGRSRRVTARS